jgi:hypothetical protein
VYGAQENIQLTSEGAQENPTKSITKIKGTKYSNKTYSVRSDIRSGSSGTNRNTTYKRNATKSHEQTQPASDLTELNQIIKNLMNQMGTLINLMSVLVNSSI